MLRKTLSIIALVFLVSFTLSCSATEAQVAEEPVEEEIIISEYKGGKMNNTKKLILDVDPGRDDAIAIMLAILSPKIELVGITTVNGNRPVWECTENALRVIDLIEANVPVFEGSSLPLLVHLYKDRRPPIPRLKPCPIEGGLLEIPKAVSKKQSQGAVSWLIETIMESDGDIILVPLGPMTNIALAIRMEPRITEKIQEIVFMGGSAESGNVTPYAEFNIWMDPEAAKIVLNSGIKKITMVGLNVTHKALISSDECDTLHDIGTKASMASANFIKGRITGGEIQGQDAAPVHDALAVASIIDDAVIKTCYCNVDVEALPGITDGRTICDFNSEERNNVYVAIKVNRDIFYKTLIDILSLSI